MKLFFQDAWNNSVNLVDREPKERDYVWASELGKPAIDIYLSMKGTPPTNPPNARSRRKFWAGNVWEFVAGLILHQLGIVQTKQQDIWIEDTPLKIHGKLDYLIGGKPDYSKAREIISSYPFDKEMTERFLTTIENFEQTFGDAEIETMVYEIKSCSEYVIEKLQGGGCIPAHDEQISVYLRGLALPEGHIVYISKNDALMFERIVHYPNPIISTRIYDKLSELKNCFELNSPPEKAPLILWENKFTKNFGVEYSSYLTYVYGFERPDTYSDSVKGKIASWNRVLKRIQDVEAGGETKGGKKITLTDKNKIAIEEMNKENFDAYSLAKQAKIETDEEEN